MNVHDIIAPIDDPAGKMAEMVANLKYEDIPKEHVEYIKRDVLDSMASILAGSTEQTTRTAVEMAKYWGGSGNSKIFVFGNKVPAPFAAFANGTMTRARDMGDTGNNGGHICEWIIPAMLSGLSMTDRKITGKEFIAAFVAGAEWGSREHITVKVTRYNQSTPGECAGPRYATASLSKLLGLNKEQVWTAQGLAYCARPQSEMQKCNEGTSCIRLQHGYVCADAIKSVSLAKASDKIVAPKGIYMGIGGLLKNVMHQDLLPPETLFEDLGSRWMWREQITMKPYAGCKYNHCEICGLLRLMKEHSFTWREIDKLHFIVSKGGLHVFEPVEQKWHPDTGEAAMFSAPYSIAYAAVHGDCFLDAYSDETVQKLMADPEFIKLMNSITYDSDDNLPNFDDYTTIVTLKDGRTFSRKETDLPGNVNNPMTWDEIESKFWKATRYSAIDLGKDRYQQVIEICKNLEELNDLQELLDAICA